MVLRYAHREAATIHSDAILSKTRVSRMISFAAARSGDAGANVSEGLRSGLDERFATASVGCQGAGNG